LKHRITVAALALVGLVGLVGMPAAATAQQVPDITDTEFLGQAAQANRFEIVTGALAQQRGRSRAVRSLGKMFKVDHTAALAKGSAVAAKLGVTPPAGLNPAQQATADKLAKLRGRKFDRAWLKAQIAAHVEAVALHLRAALNGDTPDVRTLAITALPVVSQHLGELNVVAGAKHGGGGHHH
jgi:putative membrane protein